MRATGGLLGRVGLLPHALAALAALALGLWATGAAAASGPERLLALLLLTQAAAIGFAPPLSPWRLASWPVLGTGAAALAWLLQAGGGVGWRCWLGLALQLLTLTAWQKLLRADEEGRPARRAAFLAGWTLLGAAPLWAAALPGWALSLSPISHSALAAQIDWLHLDWFYRHLPLAGLPLSYPQLNHVLVGQLALAGLALAALALRVRLPFLHPDLESAP